LTGRSDAGLYLPACRPDRDYVSTRLKVSHRGAPQIGQKEFPFLYNGLAVALEVGRATRALQMDEVVVAMRVGDFLSAAINFETVALGPRDTDRAKRA
jgi:hypothetical protein